MKKINGSRVLVTGGSGFIGTNVVEYLLNNNCEVINIDSKEPLNEKHIEYWKKLNINDLNALSLAMEEFKADYVIHLAARCDLDGKKLSDYDANITGVKNLIEVVKNNDTIKKIVFTSSMLVCHPGYVPKGEKDYSPTTVYGESKVCTEKIVWESDLDIDWAILRPTSIWGPWFSVPYRNFFDIVLKRRYVHIGGNNSCMTYGYVENSVAQIMSILLNDTRQGHKVFYLGDYDPVVLETWADEIASVRGIKIPTIPKWIIRCAAFVGDVLKLLHIPFPLTSFRLKNMTTSNVIDLAFTQQILQSLPVSRIDGVKRTLNWMEKQR